MVRVTASPAAEADIVAILEYGVPRWGRDEALAFALSFGEAYDLLAIHPEIGRERSDLEPDLRSWLHRGYVLFYRFDGQTVLISRIIHGVADVGAVIEWH